MFYSTFIKHNQQQKPLNKVKLKVYNRLVFSLFKILQQFPKSLILEKKGFVVLIEFMRFKFPKMCLNLDLGRKHKIEKMPVIRLLKMLI